MYPQKRTVIICILACLISLILIFTFGFWLGSSSVSQEISVSQDSLLLKDYNGKIALFYPPNETPSIVYDIYTETLPELDRQRLARGILLADNSELELYLEDFDS